MTAFIAFLIVFIKYLEEILSFLILVRVILSWFPNMRPNVVTKFVFDATQPLFALVYRFIPSLRNSAVDFSPIIVFFGLQLLRNVIIGLLLNLV